MISGQAKIAGVIGDPISHSLSPKIHNFLLQKYQIDAVYIPLKISTTDLASCLKLLPKMGFVGCNITIPHKEQAFKLCDSLSKAASSTKAVNTILFTQDGRIYGHNSDGEGFVNNLCCQYPNFSFLNKNTAILGAGGAARSIVFSLLKQKIGNIKIINRSQERAEKIIQDFKKFTSNSQISYSNWLEGWENLSDCDLLINSTSLGMENQPSLNLKLGRIKNSTLICDIVYKPLMTNLLKDAKTRNNPILTGIGMLIHQALVGFEMWFGIKPNSDDVNEIESILLGNIQQQLN